MHGGLPYLATGTGPPLVVLMGLSTENAVPAGMERRMLLRMVDPLPERFTTYLVNRRRGLTEGTTMPELAAEVAAAIRHDLDGAVPLMGISTGGSLALQTAVDHPSVVARLVVAGAACRLGPKGREAQRRLAQATRAGRPGQGWAAVGAATGATRLGKLVMASTLRVMGRLIDPDDPSDMLATIDAEDAFDVCGDLHRISAPALVVAGGRDDFYTTELLRRTARGIPDSRLRMYPGKGHMGVLAHRPARLAICSFLTSDVAETR